MRVVVLGLRVAEVHGLVRDAVGDDLALVVVLAQRLGGELPLRGIARHRVVCSGEAVGLGGIRGLGIGGGNGHRDGIRTCLPLVVAAVPVLDELDVLHAHARVDDAEVEAHAVVGRLALVGHVVVLVGRGDEVARQVLGVRLLERVGGVARVEGAALADGGFDYLEGRAVGARLLGAAFAAPRRDQVVGVDIAAVAVCQPAVVAALGRDRVRTRRGDPVEHGRVDCDVDESGVVGNRVGAVLDPCAVIALRREEQLEGRVLAVLLLAAVVPDVADADRRVAALPRVALPRRGDADLLLCPGRRVVDLFLGRARRLVVRVPAGVGLLNRVHVLVALRVVARQVAGTLRIAGLREVVVARDLQRLAGNAAVRRRIVRRKCERLRADGLVVLVDGVGEGGAGILVPLPGLVVPGLFEALRQALRDVDFRVAHKRVGEGEGLARVAVVRHVHGRLVAVAVGGQQVGLVAVLVDGRRLVIGKRAVVVLVELHRRNAQVVREGLPVGVVLGQAGLRGLVCAAAVLELVVRRGERGGLGAEPGHGHRLAVARAVAGDLPVHRLAERERDLGVDVLARRGDPALACREVGRARDAVFHGLAVEDVVVGVIAVGYLFAVGVDADGLIGVPVRLAGVSHRLLGEIAVGHAVFVEVGQLGRSVRGRDRDDLHARPGLGALHRHRVHERHRRGRLVVASRSIGKTVQREGGTRALRDCVRSTVVLPRLLDGEAGLVAQGQLERAAAVDRRLARGVVAGVRVRMRVNRAGGDLVPVCLEVVVDRGEAVVVAVARRVVAQAVGQREGKRVAGAGHHDVALGSGVRCREANGLGIARGERSRQREFAEQVGIARARAECIGIVAPVDRDRDLLLLGVDEQAVGDGVVGFVPARVAVGRALLRKTVVDVVPRTLGVGLGVELLVEAVDPRVVRRIRRLVGGRARKREGARVVAVNARAPAVGTGRALRFEREADAGLVRARCSVVVPVGLDSDIRRRLLGVEGHVLGERLSRGAVVLAAVGLVDGIGRVDDEGDRGSVVFGGQVDIGHGYGDLDVGGGCRAHRERTVGHLRGRPARIGHRHACALGQLAQGKGHGPVARVVLHVVVDGVGVGRAAVLVLRDSRGRLRSGQADASREHAEQRHQRVFLFRRLRSAGIGTLRLGRAELGILRRRGVRVLGGLGNARPRHPDLARVCCGAFCVGIRALGREARLGRNRHRVAGAARCGGVRVHRVGGGLRGAVLARVRDVVGIGALRIDAGDKGAVLRARLIRPRVGHALDLEAVERIRRSVVVGVRVRIRCRDGVLDLLRREHDPAGLRVDVRPAVVRARVGSAP